MRYFISLPTPRALHLLKTPLNLNTFQNNNTEVKNNLHCSPLMISRPQGYKKHPITLQLCFTALLLSTVTILCSVSSHVLPLPIQLNCIHFYVSVINTYLIGVIRYHISFDFFFVLERLRVFDCLQTS